MIKYDVIIVGAGIAGLYAAMNLPKEKKILIINKRETFKCNSFYAQAALLWRLIKRIFLYM